MFKSLANLFTNEDGATLVEYGLIVALIAVVAVVAVKTLGTTVTAAFNNINSKI
jgi:pilus assembly protein Flp/PilA